MSENQNSKVANLDEHIALKNLVKSISDDELETAKKYIEALEQVSKKPNTKPKG
ncbi:hypothetical protein [Lysinibacillus sp. Bpr_S20]|uniref:hypothetical protein n=1 Tax=Lysinibacillus sp. Bpr_S20 TaxID=2933964 RepID=UPI002013ABCE|nr:hypothetical protein [Lysinibacillus sp. Bpr_S20]MCL1700736.1 hypothetical protein [Lysinibacillus sp. Bpr_S20]